MEDNKQCLDEFNESYWLNEICASNGLESNKCDCEDVKQLELFLSLIPKLPSFELFAKLHTLLFVGCAIKKIENLEGLVGLKELWICEGNITRIEGLENNANLEALYLYDNSISKIENISHLTELKTLWLNKNEIQAIEGIAPLVHLKTLNLCDNKIRRIEPSIKHNISLETVNLSGNMISSLEDIKNLSTLPKLVSLGLRDPMSTANLVALLSNYSIYVLYHIPTLQRLDSYNVSQGKLKDLSASIVEKKKIFYKMKLKSLERFCTTTKIILKNEMESLQEGNVSSLRKLINCTKEIEREIAEMKKGGNEEEHDRSGVESESTCSTQGFSMQALKHKLDAVKECIQFRELKYNRCYSDYEDVCKQTTIMKDFLVGCLQAEFASGGNIRFELGSSSDVWYNSCVDLVHSRFAAYEYKNLKVTGVKLHKITRIHNCLLKMKYDEKFRTLNPDETLMPRKDSQGRILMDYLFVRFDNRLPPDKCTIMRILKNGFNQSTDGNQRSSHLIQVTNSLYLSDKYRMNTIISKNKDSAMELCSFRFGCIVVCKVYIGKACSVNAEKRYNSTSYPSFDSLYKTKKHLNCPHRMTLKRSNHLTSLDNTCECTSRRCTWFPFEADLVLPEYIVDFEYITAVTRPMIKVLSSIISLQNSDEVCAKNNINHIHSKLQGEQLEKDDEVLECFPVIASRPRLTFLTDDVILCQAGKSVTSQITELNLHGSGLTKVKLLSILPNLKRLVLSFNELTSLSDLSGMPLLEYLDVSFNQIVGLDGFKNVPNLQYLDISWNSFYYTREEVGMMRKYLSTLKVLRTSHNPWMKQDSMRLRCIGRLRSLILLDDNAVTEEETNIALRLATSSRIAYITILANSRTDVQPVRTLSLSKTTEILMETSTKKPVKLNEDDKKWLINTTCLHLVGHHLSKISNLEKLTNLKWASFDNNNITRIEGLETCKHLVELSLSGNCITRLEGLNILTSLETLDVSDNSITSLDGISFEKLERLQYLAFDNNFVTSLKCLNYSTSLVEIYAGNNKIYQTREIFHLKSILTLNILDVLGNPFVEDMSDYRFFVVYHLQYLKALDGEPVEQLERGLAKDAFDGKLTTDAIAEKLGHSNFLELCELDLPNYNIRNVELTHGELFSNLKSLNLEQNNLTHFGGLIYLDNLKVLCLNHNHIECILPTKSLAIPYAQTNKLCIPPNGYPTILTKLEVLHLGYNGIENLAALQLNYLSSLKALFLQGNDISKVDGLDGLECLQELVLDKNKIKNFHEYSFISVPRLTELHVEGNRLRDLTHLDCLVNLQRLYVGLNRIQDVTELEKLDVLTSLFEVSFIGNPVARKLMHRPILVFRQRNLLSIDGLPVTNEERTKAELYFIEQQGGYQALQAITNSFNAKFPELIAKSKQSLNVASLMNPASDQFWNPFQETSELETRAFKTSKKQENSKSPSRGDRKKMRDYGKYRK